MSLLDPKWKYTPSVKTDIRKTIARELRRLAAEKAEQERRQAEADAEAARVVEPMRKRAGAKP